MLRGYKPVFLIILSFFLVNVLTLLIAPKLIPFEGFFPGRGVALEYSLPDFYSNLSNFDGVHYLSIAKNGYQQYEQAFFPLYPVLIGFIAPVFNNNHLVAAIVLSNLCFVLSIFILNKYLQLLNIKPSHRLWFNLFFIFFSTSFYFSTVYNESLFFLLLISSLYFWKKGRHVPSLFFAALSSLTRLIGIFLFIPFIIDWLFSKNRKLKTFVLAFSPFLGLLIYSIYLYRTTGDPLFFFNAQPAFGANRSTSLILFPQVIYRYIKIFILAAPDFKYFIAIFEFFTFIFFAAILSLQFIKLVRDRQKMDKNILGLNLFSIANLVLPTLTGTFSSLPRYSLMSISAFIFLAQLKNKFLKIIILAIFLILHMFTFALFSQGYFIS